MPQSILVSLFFHFFTDTYMHPYIVDGQYPHAAPALLAAPGPATWTAVVTHLSAKVMPAEIHVT